MKLTHIFVSLFASVALSFWSVAAMGQVPVEIDVDCDAGDTLTDAIATEGDFGVPLILNVTGTCYEHPRVNRNSVVIDGGGTAVLHGSLRNWGMRLTVRNITITGDSFGFSASVGRSRLINVDISHNVEAGILISGGGTVFLRNSRVQHNNGLAGVAIETGFLTVDNSEITDNWAGIDATMGRVMLGDGAIIVDNIGAGVIGNLHTSILADGIVKIENNGEHGVQLMLDSGFLARGDVSINDNAWYDVACIDRESSARFEDAYPGRVWCTGFRW